MRYNELTTEARTLGGFAVKPVNVQGQEVDEQGMSEDDDAMAAFLARGGEVQRLKPAKPRKGEGWQGSAHIGAAGGRGNTKGRVSGLGANTGKSGKPVVTAEDGAPVTHRIGLTVTDPNHPMVSKRQETYHKTVRVKGDDREKAINGAIAHARRKGYKVHDHHYIGTVDNEPMAEGATGAKPGWMLKQDPALAKKVKDSKRGHEALKKWAGKPVPKQDKEVDEAIKLDAPQRRIDRDELQGYADRIKTGTKTKQDKFAPIIHGSNIKAITTDSGEEWDLDDLARQITTRPRSILGTNAKMEKSANEGEIVYDLTLPALSGIVVDEENGDFVEITTCPGAGECQLFCYARKGGYVMFPASSMSAAQALNFLVNDPEGYTAVVNKEIQQIKAKTDKRSIQLVVRWHDAGDFFSKEYLDLAYGVAEANPNVKFYAYTKMGDVATGNKPANFIINFSSGAKRAQDKKIEIHKAAGNQVKQGLTLPKDMFRGLFVTDAKGKYVKDEKGRTQVKGDAEWNQFKQNLAAKYKIDPDTIITYDQMLKVPEGPQPKWNVVIFPAGHGDRAANRLDVENSFLMFH